MPENVVEIANLAIARATRLKTREKLIVAEAAIAAGGSRFLSRPDVEKAIARPLGQGTWDPELFEDGAYRDAEAMERLGLKAVSFWEGNFPPLLREIAQAPFLLFYRGRLPDPERPLLAIVGTRRPTAAGRREAYRCAYSVAGSGVNVVSGLARGIDSAAHTGCADARGRTVAILGNGIDSVYPAESRPLARRILETGGCLISEYPPGTPPAKYRFPERNRIISGLCRGTLVVQAPERSGALITADYALEQGRDLFVSAASLESPEGAGLRPLVGDGAPAIRSAAEILAEWGVPLVEEPSAPIMEAPENEGKVGAFLARNLELELEGRALKFFGESYRSVRHHG